MPRSTAVANKETDVHPVIARILGDEEIIESDDDAAMAIAARIMNNDSAEDVLADGEMQAVKTDNLIGVPFWIHGYEVGKSTVEGDGPPIFFRLSISRPGMEDEREIVSCGAVGVMAAVRRLKELDSLPIGHVTFKASRTASGFDALNLIRSNGTVDASSSDF